MQKYINDAKCLLQKIKSFKDAMNEPEKLKTDTESMEDTIPLDVIQSALSYLPYQTTIKSVSTSFKNMSDKNKILHKRARDNMIASHFKGKNVWKAHKTKNGISLQKNDEPSIFVSDLDDIFAAIVSGDKIVFEEGKYWLLPHRNGITLPRKDVQIEGIGECIFTFFKPKRSYISINGSISIKNVQIRDVRFKLAHDNITAYFSDCIFKNSEIFNDTGLGSMVHANIDCNNCRFSGICQDSCALRIWSEPCSFSVENCLFDDNLTISIDVKVDKVDLKFIGNTFRDVANCRFPLDIDSYAHKYWMYWVNDQAIIKLNTVNGIKVSGTDIFEIFYRS